MRQNHDSHHGEDSRAEHHAHRDRCNETREFDASGVIGSPQQADSDSLFESFERRSIRSIIEEQKAYRESQAAQAARVILDDVELPDFDHYEQHTAEYEDFEQGSAHAPSVLRLRAPEATTRFGVLVSPGAQIVYILLIIAALGGVLGLALSTDSAPLLLIAGVATPMLLPICVWRWFCWLDSSPYYYRLLTTLGEDARNLLEYRLLWKKTRSAR